MPIDRSKGVPQLITGMKPPTLSGTWHRASGLGNGDPVGHLWSYEVNHHVRLRVPQRAGI